jgi:hypothetical protein
MTPSAARRLTAWRAVVISGVDADCCWPESRAIVPGMRALCPACGLHHEVVRVLDDSDGETRKDVYQVAPLEECTQSWLTDRDVLEAHARFGQDAIVQDEDDY